MSPKYEQIPTDRIKDPERPLRSDLSPESVADLVSSIKEIGIIEPLIVTKSDKGFELIAGHRRLVAAEIAGLTVVPCLVSEITGLDKEILKIHENVARDEINPVDWANHLAYLKEQFNVTTDKLASMLKVSPGWVSQRLGILDYPGPLLEAVKTGALAFSAARELAQIKDEVKRKVYTNAAIKGGVTPDQAAQWRREANQGKPEIVPTTTEAQETGPELPTTSNPPICPVCNTEIALDEIITLQIHSKCQPA